MRTHNVAVIPGDGIGTEVIGAGKKVLEALAVILPLILRSLIGAPSGTWIKASTFLKVALKN